MNIWVKVFKNGPKYLWKTAFKKFQTNQICLGRPYHFKISKGCLPQILLGPFLNTLTNLFVNFLLNNKADTNATGKTRTFILMGVFWSLN